MVNVGVSFFLAPFVVNTLGSTRYGLWAVTMQFTGYLYLLDFGVRESVIRYTSKYMARNHGARLNRILTVAFGVYGPITLLTLVVTGVFVWQAPHLLDYDASYDAEARWAIAFVGMTIAQTFIFNVFTGIVLGLQRWSTVNASNVVLALARTLAIVIALKAGYGIAAMAAIQFIAGTLSGLFVWFLAARYLRQAGATIRMVAMTWRRFRALATRVFRYGLFVFLSNIGQKIIVASDALIIAAFLPIASVTYFAIAGSLIDSLRSLLGSSSQVFAPIASRLHTTGDRQQLGTLLVQGSKFILLLAIPVAGTFAVLGDIFIGLWMGRQFMGPAGEVLMVLAISTLLSAPTYTMGMVLYGISRHNLNAYLKIGEAVANLGLSLFLVQRLGILGVAVGTAVPQAVVCVFILPYVTCRAVGLSYSSYMWRTVTGPALAAVPFLLAELWIRHNVEFTSLLTFFGSIAALCVVYGGLVFYLALESSERSWALAVIRRRPPAQAG